MTDHLSKHYDEQLDLLKQEILRIAAMVEGALANSIRALAQGDTRLADQVISGDPYVDKLEIEIDNTSLELLALRQPVAGDLRFITTSLKIVKDLERVGDLAVDIAERAIELSAGPRMKLMPEYVTMAEAAQQMLKDSMDAFVNQDVDLAQKVLGADDRVDMLNERLFREQLVYMAANPGEIPGSLHLMFTAKYLERVGDHSSNIAEMVIFMVLGRDVRHLEKIAHLKEDSKEK